MDISNIFETYRGKRCFNIDHYKFNDIMPLKLEYNLTSYKPIYINEYNFEKYFVKIIYNPYGTSSIIVSVHFIVQWLVTVG